MSASEELLQRLQLDPSSPVPLYHQASAQLQQAIASGVLPPGTKLPNESLLAQHLNVSRPTMRMALAQLVDEGLLVRRRGIGTVVARAPIRRQVALSSLYEDLDQSGQRPRTAVLEFAEEPCPEEAREILRLTSDDQVFTFTRLRYAGDEPIALMHNTTPADLIDLSAEALEATGFYVLLRRAGVRPTIATQRIGAVAADENDQQHLGTPIGVPLIAVERTAYDQGGRPIEYAKHRYPADKYSFEVTLVDGQ